jgi:hypothetical protein
MAATNFTPIQLYYSTTASAVPLAANLAQGELAINITDGKLYYEDGSGVVQVIASKGAGTIGGSNTQVQYNNAGSLAGSANLTFNGTTLTANTLNLTNALGAVYGGTGQTSYTTGDLLYSSASNTLAKLAIGPATYILSVNSGGTNVEWAAPSSISVNTATNLAGGVAGSVPYQSAAATTTFLAIGAANRVMTSTGSAPQWVTSLTSLTGVSSSSITNTSLTSGRVVYSGASGVETDSANLTFNGTTLSAGGFSTTGLSTLVQTVKIGDSNFSGVAVFAPATPAKLYIGTGTVTDATSAIGATNATGAISSLAITPIAATNTSVTYTDAATLYIAGAPSAGTNITLTNPYALYIAAGNVYLGGGTANGVAYLNGSKVLTTGSALSFNGNTFSVNGTSPGVGINDTTATLGVSFSFLNGGAFYSYGQIALRDTTNSQTAYAYFSGASGYHNWFQNGTEKMRLTSTGLAVTGTLSSSGDATVGSAGGTRTLTIGNPAVTGAGFINLVTSNAFKNWQIASNQYVTGLSFTPSTAVGGTTYTTPVLNILDTGVNVTGTLSATTSITSIGSVGNVSTDSTGARLNFSRGADNYFQASTAGGYFAWIVNGSGSNAMALDASGNLGIGGASTGSRLYLTATNPTATFKATTTGYPYAAFVNDGGDFYVGRDTSGGGAFGYPYANVVWGSGAYSTVFATNNTVKMTLTSAGDLLVGPTSTYNGAKLAVLGAAEIRGDIRSYYASRAGLASGGTATVFSVPAGYFGYEVSMTLYICQRDDTGGSLSSSTFNITALAGGVIAVTSMGAATYGASKPFSLSTANAGGSITVTLTNNAGGAASTSINMAANVLIGYGAITWGW